jgi:hypothetical protein
VAGNHCSLHHKKKSPLSSTSHLTEKSTTHIKVLLPRKIPGFCNESKAHQMQNAPPPRAEPEFCGVEPLVNLKTLHYKLVVSNRGGGGRVGAVEKGIRDAHTVEVVIVLIICRDGWCFIHKENKLRASPSPNTQWNFLYHFEFSQKYSFFKIIH